MKIRKLPIVLLLVFTSTTILANPITVLLERFVTAASKSIVLDFVNNAQAIFALTQ